MDFESLFVNAEVVGNIVGAILTFLLGAVAVYLIQPLIERR